MTNLEALAGEIEPYSISDESLEKSLIDSCGRFGVNIEIDDDYEYRHKVVVAFAAMLCLNRLRVLTSENLGGLSQNYDVKKLEDRIKAIANESGLSADLVLDDVNEDTVKYVSVW